MFFSNVLLALAGLSSLAAAAPAPMNKGRHLAGRGVTGSSVVSKHDKRATVVVQQTVVRPNIVVVQENLALVNQLALVAEREFAALVQAQLALVQQVETIKNNIRVNHFLSRFSQVNTVIVTVTQLVDQRNRSSQNNRYLVNQLLADNGKPGSSVVVMLTAAAPMTIGLPTPTLDLSSLLGAAGATSLPSGVAASVISAATAAATAGSSSVDAAAAAAAAISSNATILSSGSDANSSAQIASFDPNNPFGTIGQSLILPYGSKAPSLPNGAQIVADPAAIILSGQPGLIVEDVRQFSQDCALFSSNSLSLFNLQAAIVAQAAQIAAAQLSGLTLGTAAALNNAVAALFGGVIGGSNNVTVTTTAATTTSTTASATAAAATTSTTQSVSAAAAESVATTATESVAQSATPSATEAAAEPATEAASASAPPEADAAAVEEAAAADPAASSAAAGGVGVQVVEPAA